MTKKKRPIPDWFNTGNYDEAENLQLCGWLEQFYIRFLLLHAIEPGSPLSKKNRLYKYMKGIRKGLVQIDPGHSCCRTRERMRVDIDTGSHPSSTLDERTVVQYEPELRDKQQKTAETVGADTNTTAEIDPVFNPFSVYLEVNPQATDEQLFNDFDRWLTQYRSLEKRAKASIQDEPEQLCRKWYKLKLLPYIDLTIRAKALGLILPLDAMMDRLDTSEYQLESTLPDWMAKVLDNNYLAALNLVVIDQGAHGIDHFAMEHKLTIRDESEATGTSGKKRDSYAADFAQSLEDLEQLHQLLNDDATTKLKSDRELIRSDSNDTV